MTNCSAISTGSDSTDGRPPIYKVIGIILAVSSGCFIGTSFIFKKLGLLKANVKYNEEAGEGYGYLKNAWWWTGMTMMIVGEICNFVAYAFVDAILVTPLGALSVVITTILSAIFLKERLSFVGKVGCFLTLVGTVVICVNSPAQATVNTIQQMQCYVISPGFLTYAGVIIVGSAVIALWAGPRYGKKSMFVYLSVCSLIGGLSVVATQGLGAAILTQIRGTAQFNQWFIYVLLVFVIATLLTEIIFLNKALNIFNAALVTPTYYVYFTSATIVASAILFQGFKGTPIQILTIVLGFLTICSGVVLLQLSKSSKDVPDTQVFSGDLDQVRTVAEQEEHESEPKADAIRGTAALIRSFSKARQSREATEAKRIYTERMEPIGENEHVEWEGLRRRKTIIEPGRQTSLPRRRTVHPPLGMSSNSSMSNDYHDLNDEPNTSSPSPHPQRHTTLLPNFRKSATSLFNPANSRRAVSTTSSGRSISFSSNPDASTSHVRGKSPVPLAEMSATSHTYSTQNAAAQPKRTQSSTSSNIDPPPVYPIDGSIDTSYHGPGSLSHIRPRTASAGAVHFADAPPSRSDSSSLHPPPPPPHHANKRSFSFQNVFNRSSPSQPRPADTHDDRPATGTSSHSSLFFGRGRNRGTSSATLDAVTEEERLGLVKGDSSFQTPEIPPPPPHKEPPQTPSKDIRMSFSSGSGGGSRHTRGSGSGSGSGHLRQDSRGEAMTSGGRNEANPPHRPSRGSRDLSIPPPSATITNFTPHAHDLSPEFDDGAFENELDAYEAQFDDDDYDYTASQAHSDAHIPDHRHRGGQSRGYDGVEEEDDDGEFDDLGAAAGEQRGRSAAHARNPSSSDSSGGFERVNLPGAGAASNARGGPGGRSPRGFV